MHRKLILFISASLDGYIAKPNDDLSFLSMVEKEGEDYGYFTFLNSIDTIIMGRKTFDWVMNQVPEFPNADKETFIITRNPKPSNGNIQFYNGDLKALVTRLKLEAGLDIFCDGGAEIVHELLKENLIDEIILSIIPVLLSHGIPLFKEGRPEQNLSLVSCKSFEKGLVQMHYKKA